VHFNEECISLLKRTWKWALGSWKELDKTEEKVFSGKSDSPATDDVVVVKSLLLESCTKMASICIAEEVDLAIVKQCLFQLRSHAEKLLLAHSSSIWAVKGVAAFVDVLSKCDIHLNDSPNEIFEALNQYL